jgi:hypothetical protein
MKRNNLESIASLTSSDIIIVNWNSINQLSNCLSSIQKYWTDAIARIVVVDNASSDGSADGIADRFADLPVEVICNDENLGFARACNQGARVGSAPYLLFLNPDAKIFDQSISRPMQYMEAEKNADVGICGVQLVDESGTVSRTCARFPTLGRLTAQALGLNKIPGLKHTGMHMKDWDHRHTAEVDQVMGSFFLIRRQLFEALGGFDERYFVYFEEVDLSFRAKCAGFKSMYLTEAKAYHAGGGTSHQVKAMRLFYSLRSRLLYGFKHFPLWQAWVLTGVTMIMEPVSRFFFCAFKRDWKGIHNTAKGYRYLWLSLPQVIGQPEERKHAQ